MCFSLQVCADLKGKKKKRKKKDKIHSGPPHDVVYVQYRVSKEDESGAENGRKEM